MESTEESSLSKIFTWSGSRTSHGFAYEKDLAFTLFVAASLEEHRFRLATEMNVAGKFDDAVLILDDRKEVWFFQAKHSQTSNGKIAYEEFFPSSLEENSQFSLPMYIQSFLNVSKRSEFKSYDKRFIIFSNKSIDENATHKLRELMDVKGCPLIDSLEKKLFIRSSEKFVPNAEQIQDLLEKLNELPVAIRDAIIELQRTGTVKSILRKYTTPLRSILDIDNSVRFSETFTGNEDEINQQRLWNELQTHFITEIGITQHMSEVVFNKKIDKRLLQNKSGETSFPRFIEESDLRSFFEHLVICTGQPDQLFPLRDGIVESVLRMWIHGKDRSLFSDRTKLHVIFEKEFENWHMVTNLDGNLKPFLSSYEGNMCVQMIKAEVRKVLQKVTPAVLSTYVERKLVLQNGQEEFTEDKFISMLEQSSGRNGYILVGEPGMGKTTFMKRITHRLQADDFNKHVYLIFLSRLFKNYEKGNDIFILIKSALSKSIQQLIQNSLEHCPQQCFILLDGFDEIDTLHHGSAIKLIKETFCKNNIRVFISGRIHVKERLEKELHVQALNLVPLIEDEQLLFLRNYWEISADIDGKEMDRFQRFAKHLLRMLHDNIQSDYFTGLPLVVRMLAEVYRENFEKYWESTNDYINEILDLESRFSVLRLYESFINISFNIFIRKINNEEGYATIDSKIINFFKDNLEKCHRAHQLIAIKQLKIPELREILSTDDSATILENMQQILDDGEKSLIVNVFNKDHLKFTHLSYAEYFLSKFLYEHVIECEAFLFNVLSRYEVVRTFFFSMIEENWEDSSLQMDTINDICYEDTGLMYLACSGGYESILKELLKHHKATVKSSVDKIVSGGSLLHAAVESNKENMLKLILCEYRFGNCTHHKVNYNAMKTYETEIDINTPDYRGSLPIHYAAYNGNEQFVKMLAQHGADKNINARDDRGNAPLHFAAQNGFCQLAKMLIDQYSADYKIVNNRGYTLMHMAAGSGNMEIVNILMEDYAADVNAQENDGNTPLHLAAKQLKWEIIQMMITKYSADCSIVNANGQTLIHIAAEKGNMDIVKMLIDEYAADVNMQDENGNTPLLLAAKNYEWEMVEMIIKRYSVDCEIANEIGEFLIHVAAESGTVEVVKMLMDRTTDINTPDHDGNTPLYLAARNNNWEAVQIILKKYPAVSRIDQNNEQTLIRLAAKGGSKKILKMFLDDHETDVNAQDNNGNTLLHLAVENSIEAEGANIEIVKMLIDDYGADVNTQNKNGNTPLHLAAKKLKWEMVQTFIKRYSADCKTVNANGQTLIHLAATRRNMGTVKMLIDDYAADVNEQDINGDTPLHLAAKHYDWEMARMIIKNYSAKYEIVNKLGENFIHLAAAGGNKEIIKMLIDDYEADFNTPDKKGNTPLHIAVKNFDWDILQTIIEKHSADYNITNANDQTLTHLSAERGNKEIVMMLIDGYGADINKKDKNGDTPLHLAAKNFKWEMVQMMIKKYSADITIKNAKGQTLIHLAAERGNKEIVMMLIDIDSVGVNTQDNNGNTPIDLAAKKFKWRMIQMILNRHSADFEIHIKNGQTLILLAAVESNVKIVRMLMDDYAADVDKQDNNGDTPLHLAAKNFKWEMVQMMIKKYSADITIKNAKGQTLIHLAAGRGNMEIVTMLIDDYAVDFNQPDENGNTPLHLAAKNYQWEMVQMILKRYSADCKIANKKGQTLIHLATAEGDDEIIKMLIDDYEADVNAQDNYGYTPLHIAVEYSVEAEGGYMEIVMMLIDNYAADVNKQDNSGNTPLHIAALTYQWEMVQMILKRYSANYKIANKYGQTLIHLAAERGNIEIVRMLEGNYEADVNAQYNDGNIPVENSKNSKS